MNKTICFIALTMMMIASSQAFAVLDLGNFTWGKDDPLLQAAMEEDPFSTIGQAGRSGEDYDSQKAYALYEQFLKERELEPHQRAEILAHLGIMDMYCLAPRDEEKARVHFEEALKLAGDDYLTGDIIGAKTNYAPLIKDPDKRFEAYVEIVKLIQGLNEEKLAAEFAKNHPDPIQMMRNTNMDTGEVTEVPLAEAWPEALQEPQSVQEAKNQMRILHTFITVQLPDVCVDFALVTSDPDAAMQRLIDIAPDTPIAKKAAAAMGKAVFVKGANEEIKAEAEKK